MQYWVKIRYFTVIRYQQLKVYYHSVPSKWPWALAAQAGVGSCTEEVLEWLNYPRASAHHGSN